MKGECGYWQTKEVQGFYGLFGDMTHGTSTRDFMAFCSQKLNIFNSPHLQIFNVDNIVFKFVFNHANKYKQIQSLTRQLFLNFA